MQGDRINHDRGMGGVIVCPSCRGREGAAERATESCVAVPAYNGEPCGGGACACHDLAINGGTEPDYHDMAMEDQMADAAGVGDNGPGRF
jgi:hypothetical protein